METATRVSIDWLIRRHMPDVLEIEEASFQFPWPEEDFVRFLRRRNCIGMAAEHEGQLAGYMLYELFPTRIELHNLAVAPEFRRCGVGRQMLAKLKGKLGGRRRRIVVKHLDEHNDRGIEFFRAMGFRGTGLIPYAFLPWSDADAIRMEYRA